MPHRWVRGNLNHSDALVEAQSMPGEDQGRRVIRTTGSTLSVLASKSPTNNIAEVEQALA